MAERRFSLLSWQGLMISLFVGLSCCVMASASIPCSFAVGFKSWLAPLNAACPPTQALYPCASDANCTAIASVCAYGGTAALKCIVPEASQQQQRFCGFVSSALPTLSAVGGTCDTDAGLTCALCSGTPCGDGISMCVYPSDCQSGGSRKLPLKCFANGSAAVA